MTSDEIEIITQPLNEILEGHRKTHVIVNQCFKTSHKLGAHVREQINKLLPHYRGEPITVEIGNLSQGGASLLNDRLCRHYADNLPPLGLHGRVGPEEYHAWLKFAGTIIDLTFLYSMAGLEHSADLEPHILFVSRDGLMIPTAYPFEYVPYRGWNIADINSRGHR